MKNNISLLLILIASIFSFDIALSQTDTIYLDENYNKLSKSTFHQRLESKVYDGFRHSTDTMVLEILKLKYIFGNLDQNIKSQLFMLFAARHKIDTTKVLSILYIDTLKAKKDFPKKNYALIKDQYGNVIGKEKFQYGWIYPPGEYIDTRKYRKTRSKGEVKISTEYKYKAFLKNCKQFLAIHKKYDNVTPLIFYNFNAGTLEEVRDLNAYKDFGQILRKLFFTNDISKFIVIKSDGEYYASHVTLNLLFEDKDWNKQKALFLKMNE